MNRRRTRRSADEARERILEAAEHHLIAAGPDGLKLTELARELGLTHPAILHHFGSREDLVRAVLERAYGRLRDDILDAIEHTDDPLVSAPLLFDHARRVLGERGHARLFGWLVLSGRALPPLFQAEPLRPIVDAVHAARGAGRSRRTRAETRHAVHLAGLALLGEALFGDRLREMQGREASPAEAEDFHHWLIDLLTERLLAEPADPSRSS